MSRRRYFAIGFFGLLACVRAWAWGCTGHEVVALIALQNLRPDVATQVEGLLATQDHNYSGRYCTDISLDAIAYYATWADDYRSGHPKTGAWHYWDVPLYLSSTTADQYCEGGCVIQALNEQLAILRDPKQDNGKRANALKFLVHFVGDVHQPLHTEDNNDRGGNCVPVDFLQHATSETDVVSGSYTPNLHGVWDTEIVEHIGGITSRTQESVEDLAAKVSRDRASVIRQARDEQVDFVKWALEAHGVAQKDPYAKLPKKIAVAQEADPVTLCSDRNTSENIARKHESIKKSYLDAVDGDVELQLARAGGRLAAVLNSAWPAPVRH